MSVRPTAVAGQFYEADHGECRSHIEHMIQDIHFDQKLPDKIIGGIVPHAGWMFSGSLACMVFEAIRQQNKQVDTFVIFGAIHTMPAGCGLIYESGQWETPLGNIDIDESLCTDIIEISSNIIRKDRDAHRREHSIEVQAPIIKQMFNGTKIAPILVPPIPLAPQMGNIVAQAIEKSDKNILCIGSTDLTHYGPSYRFTPMGVGQEANEWAKWKNDRFFIDLALAMKAEQLVESAEMYGSACGSGAVAATVAAAVRLGAKNGTLLEHTTSAEVLSQKFKRKAEDSVGYCAVIYD